MSLHDTLSRFSSEPEWSQPVVIPARDEERIEELLESGKVHYVSNPVDRIADEMKENHLLGDQDTIDDRSNFVFFPWNGEMVRYADRDSHLQLRTNRNRPLIRGDEQDRLYRSTVVNIGLSVGSKIMHQSVQSGVGHRRIFGDPDVIDPTNLNRLDASMSNVGENKTSVAAKKISLADPYTEQVHLERGFDAQSGSLLDQYDIDVIIEEVDDIAIKAMIRHYAAQRGVPVVMMTDLGEKSIADVERYDIDRDTPPFNGKLDREFVNELMYGHNPTEDEKTKALMRLSGGLRQIPPRIVESAYEIRRGRVHSIPQLGATAANGAVLADMITRDIILGRHVPSGSYYDNPRKDMSLRPVDSKRTIIDIYRNFLSTRKHN